MSKHTPGPWVADFHTEKVYSADNVVVYELGTNEADGYLISAAPDLLEALTFCFAQLEQEYMPSDESKSAMAKARAAIAKAKGEA